MAEAPCPVYGTHHMISQGFASVRDQNGDTVSELNGGGWYKCACGERFICWGQPHFGKAITYYVTEGAIISQTGSSGIGAFTVNRNYIYFTDKATLEGYQFLSA